MLSAVQTNRNSAPKIIPQPVMLLLRQWTSSIDTVSKAPLQGSPWNDRGLSRINKFEDCCCVTTSTLTVGGYNTRQQMTAASKYLLCCAC